MYHHSLKKSWNFFFTFTKIGTLFLSSRWFDFSDPESRSFAWFFYRFNSCTISLNSARIVRCGFPEFGSIYPISRSISSTPIPCHPDPPLLHPQGSLTRFLRYRNPSPWATGLKALGWFGHWISVQKSQWSKSRSRNYGASVVLLEIHGTNEQQLWRAKYLPWSPIIIQNIVYMTLFIIKLSL